MSWTYSGDPKSSKKDEVRFLIGDTDSSEQLATDEEIQYTLDTNGNDMWVAGSYIADAIAFRFSRMADSEEIGPIKINYTKRVEFFTAKAKNLAAKVYQFAQISPYAGGIDVADVLATDNDTSLVSPNFTLGMNDIVTSITESIKS